RVAIAAEAARDADLILLVVDGPLRDSEHQLLARLGEMQKRILVCLNKTDWYDDEEKRRLLAQIASQVRGLVESDDIVAVRSQAAMRARVRVLADGIEQEEQVSVPPDTTALARQMLAVVSKDGRELLLANLLLR